MSANIICFLPHLHLSLSPVGIFTMFHHSFDDSYSACLSNSVSDLVCQRVTAAWFLVEWWDRWRGRKRYGLIWGREGVRWHRNVKKGMHPSYTGLTLSLPFAFLLCHVSKMLAGARPIACGYLFMCNLSEGWPLSPFSKKAIYNSIQVYLPHSQCSTIIHPGPCFSAWFHKVLQCLRCGYPEKVSHYYTLSEWFTMEWGEAQDSCDEVRWQQRRWWCCITPGFR